MRLKKINFLFVWFFLSHSDQHVIKYRAPACAYVYVCVCVCVCLCACVCVCVTCVSAYVKANIAVLGVCTWIGLIVKLTQISYLNDECDILFLNSLSPCRC